MHDGSGRITVQSLTKQFGAITAVQNLSFTVEPGSVTGFLGPNGAGKTTTLRTLLGLVRQTAGTTTINGVPFAQLGNPARVVGAVLEAQGFHPRRTARNHLLVYTAAIGVPDTRADEVLYQVGLNPAATRSAGGFSLGMKQRLALATALLGDPQILVLDEPGNGLDPEGIAWLRSFLQSFARSGRTVLISSHLLAEVEQTVDHVVIISRGQTMYNGPLEHLRRSQQNRVLVRPSDLAALTTALREEEIYNIEALPDGRLAVGGVTPERVADIALKASVSVYGIEEERVNLEQLYFRLTNGQYPAAAPGGQPIAPLAPGTWTGADYFQSPGPVPPPVAQLPPVTQFPPQQSVSQQFPAQQQFPVQQQQFPVQDQVPAPVTQQISAQHFPQQPYAPQPYPPQPQFPPQQQVPPPGYQQPVGYQPGYPPSGAFPAQQPYEQYQQYAPPVPPAQQEPPEQSPQAPVEDQRPADGGSKGSN